MLAKGLIGSKEVVQELGEMGISYEGVEEGREEVEERCRRGCELRVDMGVGT